jgi:hypothetical protein
MIRINLLPYKESTLVQWGQRQVLLYVVAVLVSGVVCVIWAQRLPDPQKKKKQLIAERAKYETKTREVKAKKTCKMSRYKKAIRKANRKYKAIDRLIFSRRSPKLVLRELSRILSEDCPSCEGRGFVMTAETVCFEIFREIIRQARQFDFDEALVLAHQDVVDLLLDEQAHGLADLEEHTGKSIRLQTEALYLQDQFDVVLL